MEPATTIKQMLKDGHIIVPDYQRAYSWEADVNAKTALHVNVFLSDLEDYIELPVGTYYFGHFLFETIPGGSVVDEITYAIVDGQQRLTTITIFLALLFARLEEIRPLSERELQLKEDLVIRGRNVRFETVDHDRLFFLDYVINNTKCSRENLQYVSQRRIADAADCIRLYLSTKAESDVLKLLGTVVGAKCTTHVVTDSGEAMQMFLFQNNRGKKPSKLEVVKALLMRAAYLHGGRDRNVILRDMDDRFAEIYRDLAALEDYVDEDDVLACSCRIEANNLYEEASAVEIEKRILTNGIKWAERFVRIISEGFSQLRHFFLEESKTNLEAHAIKVIGCGAWAMPFVVKAYSLGIKPDKRKILWRIIESLLIRHRAVGTRAYIVSRLNDVFQQMTVKNAVSLLKERLFRLAKAKDWWWAYWTDEKLKEVLCCEIWDRTLSKILLWRYENELLRNGDQQGYKWKYFDALVSPELEHIAPLTPTDGKPVANGYGQYDNETRPEEGIVSGHWIDSIGNQLILPKSHNCQIGNCPFCDKYETYTHSEQQLKVRTIADRRKSEEKKLVWDKTCIERRSKSIVKILMSVYSLSDVSFQG